MGIGSLIIPGLSKLKNVLLVEGLTVNLISVSQWCDEDLFVQFTKDKCIVHNQNHCHIMEGERTVDKCYLLTNTSPCMNEIQQDQEMLFQQFGHISSNDTTITGRSSQRHLDFKAKPDQMSSM